MVDSKRDLLRNIKFPIPLLQSYIGNLLYTTDDIFNEFINEECFTQLDVSDLVFKDFDDLPLIDLQKVPSKIFPIISCRNGNGKISCMNDGLIIDNNSGRKILKINDYINRIAIDKPVAIIPLIDEIPWNSTTKRINKAKQRSIKWFSLLKESSKIDRSNTFLFGPILMDKTNKIPFSEQAVSILDQVDGFFIASSCLGEPEEHLYKTISTVRSSISDNIPILVQGVESINTMLECINNGASIISTNIPKTLTLNGRAWCFQVDLENYNIDQSDIDTVTVVSNNLMENDIDDIEENGNDHDNKKTKTSSKKRTRLTNDDKSSKDNIKELFLHRISLNLWDNKYETDTKPLLEDCQCFACRNHTRAYIHHLLKANELLSEVLLYQHNQHNLIKLFKHFSNITNKSELKLLIDKIVKKINE